MRSLILIAVLLLTGCASTPPTSNTAMLENSKMPLDALIGCAAHAIRVYDLPPRISIQLSCADEIQNLEEWAISFVERTGLTLQEVEYIIAEESAK